MSEKLVIAAVVCAAIPVALFFSPIGSLVMVKLTGETYWWWLSAVGLCACCACPEDDGVSQ